MSFTRSQLEVVCRVCVKPNEYCVYFDSMEGGSLLQLYEFCFGIVITSTEVPRNMCNACASKLQNFANFKSLAHQSEKLWKSNKNFCERNSIAKDLSHKMVKYDEGNSTTTPHFESNLKSSVFHNIIHDSICNSDVSYNFEPDQVSLSVNDDKKNSYVGIKEERDTISPKTELKCFVTKKKYNKQNKNKRNNLLDDPPKFYCGLCNVKSSRENEDKQHFTEHSSNNDLNCKLCDFVGRDFADMVTHRYDHQPKEYRIHLSCHLCAKKYLARLALQFHYRSVHLKRKGGFCTQCGKHFGTYKMWRDHERLHKTDKFKCDLCGRKFLFRHALRTHMINHSDVKGYVCDICGKDFKRNSNLKLHLQTAHDSNKVSCTHCKGTFKNQKSLQAHMKRATKNKTVQCEICSKYFDTPNVLRRHMVWHGDDRPFICNVCGLSYKSTSQLNTHMRKHTGVMPFKCTQCTKCYPTSNQLREHASTHSGVRRYKCSLCPKSFHHKKLMVKHCSKLHPDVDDTPATEATSNKD